MTQRTRNIIANILIGVSILCIVTFVVQHFMTTPRPPWHKDLAWLAIAFVIASDLARGSRRRRRAMQNPD
ncbi:MAG TPA: hypothetical protein VGM67_04960 [Gemmatimonadaceae bacterium]|jgi:hypothetical protein